MDHEPVLTPLDPRSAAATHRQEGDYIFPLSAFATKETFDKPLYPKPTRAEPPPAAMGNEIADFSI